MKDDSPKVLYFVDGYAPTRNELQAASQIKASVVFRNAQTVDANAPLEECKGVAGKVPSNYAEAYPVLDAPKKAATKQEPSKSD